MGRHARHDEDPEFRQFSGEFSDTEVMTVNQLKKFDEAATKNGNGGVERE